MAVDVATDRGCNVCNATTYKIFSYCLLGLASRWLGDTVCRFQQMMLLNYLLLFNYLLLCFNSSTCILSLYFHPKLVEVNIYSLFFWLNPKKEIEGFGWINASRLMSNEQKRTFSSGTTSHNNTYVKLVFRNNEGWRMRKFLSVNQPLSLSC